MRGLRNKKRSNNLHTSDLYWLNSILKIQIRINWKTFGLIQWPIPRGLKTFLIKKTLKFLGLSLYPWKLGRKQSFPPGNSPKLCYSAWKFRAEKPSSKFLMTFANKYPRKFHVLSPSVCIFSGIAQYVKILRYRRYILCTYSTYCDGEILSDFFFGSIWQSKIIWQKFLWFLYCLK